MHQSQYCSKSHCILFRPQDEMKTEIKHFKDNLQLAIWTASAFVILSHATLFLVYFRRLALVVLNSL